MKRISLAVAILLMAFSLHASVIISDNHNGNPTADKVMLPLFKSGKIISLANFMNLTSSRYKELTGSKMSFKEKISLKLFQHHFKNAINSDGTVNLKKFQDDEDDSEHPIGWFALGFFLGIIGLIIALVINDDKRPGRIKWALIGFGMWAAILLIVSAAVSK